MLLAVVGLDIEEIAPTSNDGAPKIHFVDRKENRFHCRPLKHGFHAVFGTALIQCAAIAGVVGAAVSDGQDEA
jgi:hypothetical protein